MTVWRSSLLLWLCLDHVLTVFGSRWMSCMYAFSFCIFVDKYEIKTTVEDTLLKEHASAMTSSGFRKVFIWKPTPCFIRICFLSFTLVAWFGNQIVKWSSRLIVEPQLNVETLYTKQLQRLCGSVLKDSSHPLHNKFQLLPFGRRFTIP